jgi:hypothetical protein
MYALSANVTRRGIALAAILTLLASMAMLIVSAGAAEAARPAHAGEKGGGNPNVSCPDGTLVVAKYEWSGGGYTAEFGADVVTSLTGDASSAAFDSSEPIAAVVVKGGTDTEIAVFDGATGGTVTNDGLVNKGGQTPDISNVKFCIDDPGTDEPGTDEPSTGEPSTEDPGTEDPDFGPIGIS